MAVVLFPVMCGAGFGAADLLPWVRCPAAGAVVPGDGQPGPDRDRPGVPWCCGCRCWLLCWCDWGTGQKHFAKHFQNRATGTALCCRWRDLLRRPGGGVALLLVLLAGCAVCGAGVCLIMWRGDRSNRQRQRATKIYFCYAFGKKIFKWGAIFGKVAQKNGHGWRLASLLYPP